MAVSDDSSDNSSWSEIEVIEMEQEDDPTEMFGAESRLDWT